jgi:trimeric autotransporter adhesin
VLIRRPLNNGSVVFVRIAISRDGSVTTIAGSGVYGYSGDGGLANRAQLSFPAGFAWDDAGNLYIADAGNNAIRV